MLLEGIKPRIYQPVGRSLYRHNSPFFPNSNRLVEVYNSTPLTLALDGGGCSTPRPGHFTPAGDPVAIVCLAGWAPGPFWTSAEKHASTGIRSPDRPARSESPYRLHCTGPHFMAVEE